MGSHRAILTCTGCSRVGMAKRETGWSSSKAKRMQKSMSTTMIPTRKWSASRHAAELLSDFESDLTAVARLKMR